MSEQLIKGLSILDKNDTTPTDEIRVSKNEDNAGDKRKLYIESYGCQMNFSDSEIVTSILQKNGFATTSDADQADLILLNTCAIRDNAEQRIRTRLGMLNKQKKKQPHLKIGVLGCMAERLKKKLLEEERIVDIVAGPDAYKDLPNLISEVDDGERAVNVQLSREETYADITPVRLNSNGVTAFISIMRGCDNMCSFCVVPYTRGRERSRDPESIVNEARDLFEKGYREVTLLGQNVDSYCFKESRKDKTGYTFAQLLEAVAKVSPLLRVRFSTSHPKDMTNDVLHTMAKYENICNYIHLPVQSGNSEVLNKMNRTYDREWYLDRVKAIREIVGHDCGISSDMIAGFCGETEKQHKDTLSLMEIVKYHFSYMFYYSERPGTLAAKYYEDDIPLETKKRRLQEIIALQSQHSSEWHKKYIGQTQKVLVEGFSKRSDEYLKGRNSENVMVVFPKENYKKGDYVYVKIEDSTSATLLGKAVPNEEMIVA